jgi:hypothetical protein
MDVMFVQLLRWFTLLRDTHGIYGLVVVHTHDLALGSGDTEWLRIHWRTGWMNLG